MKVLVFEDSQLELAELDVLSYREELASFASRPSLLYISSYLNGEYHIFPRRNLQVA